MFSPLIGEVHAQNIMIIPGFETGNYNGWTTFQSNNHVQSDGGAHGGNFYYKVYGQFNTTTDFTGGTS